PLTKGSPQSVNLSLQARGEWQNMFWRSAASNIDAKGNFEMSGVVPGEYVIQAFKGSGDGKNYIAMQNIDVHESDIDNIVRELNPPAELKGRLSMEGGVQPGTADPRITLEPIGSTMWGAGGAVKA